MPFATLQDVSHRLARDLSAGEETAVNLLLEGATAVVANAVGKAEADIQPVPPLLRFVTIEVVCRALANPSSVDGLTEQLGQYQYSARFRNPGGGLLLTDREEQLVRQTVLGQLIGSARVDSIIDDCCEDYCS